MRSDSGVPTQSGSKKLTEAKSRRMTGWKIGLIILILSIMVIGTGWDGCSWDYPYYRKEKHHDVTSGSSATNYVVKVLDSSGNAVQGAQLSLYDASLYNTDDGSGNLESLLPKATGYKTADANGDVRWFNLADGKYHAVVKATDQQTEREFNLKVPGPPPSSPNKKIELTGGSDKPFNAEGHIKYQENYTHNKYTVGDKVKFQVFGVNNSGVEAKVSFAVLDHTEFGSPNQAPEIYRGDFAETDETLTVPAGQKAHKVLEWEIPASLKNKPGRYAIHLLWDGYDKEPDGTPDPWHKIGNFFVVEDTTPLVVDAGAGGPFFTNENPTAWVTINDPAEPGTVRAQEVGIASGSGGTCYIDTDREVDTPFDAAIPGSGDADPANDFDVESSSFPVTFTAYGEVLAPEADIGKNAKTRKIRVWAIDAAGNPSYSDGEFDLHVTKAEADALADKLYDDFNIGPTNNKYPPGTYKTDWTVPYSRCPPNNIFCNRGNDGTSSGATAHTYNNQILTQFEKNDLKDDWQNFPLGGDCIEPIERCTKADFITTLQNYLQALKDAGKF